MYFMILNKLVFLFMSFNMDDKKDLGGEKDMKIRMIYVITLSVIFTIAVGLIGGGGGYNFLYSQGYDDGYDDGKEDIAARQMCALCYTGFIKETATWVNMYGERVNCYELCKQMGIEPKPGTCSQSGGKR